MDYSLTPFRGLNNPATRIFNDFNAMTPWAGDQFGAIMEPSYGWGRGGMLDTPSRAAMTEEMRKFNPILSADIVESSDDFHVYVDLPGITKQALSVSIDQSVGANGSLRIEANRDDVNEDDTEYVHRRERNHGRVTRTLPIPQGADNHKVKTLFENGMLKITFKKQAGDHSTASHQLVWER